MGNISTRLSVGTDDFVSIIGFIVGGDTTKKLIVRGIGPSLAQAVVRSGRTTSQPAVPDPLQDPTLELYDSSGRRIAFNDNWPSSASEPEIFQSGLAPRDSREAAILVNLPTGAYTAILRGKNHTTGVGLVEVYDLEAESHSKLRNISTRGFVLTGDKVMIGGWIVTGRNPVEVVIRAIGPSLARAGVPSVLADPVLELYDGDGHLFLSNDNWQDSQRTEIEEIGLVPEDTRESAILVTLNPGTYTAIVRGKNSSTGQALVEVYDVN